MKRPIPDHVCTRTHTFVGGTLMLMCSWQTLVMVVVIAPVTPLAPMMMSPMLHGH